MRTATPIRDLNQGLPSAGPQGLKPASSLALGGTTEVVPFPNLGESVPLLFNLAMSGGRGE
jgi:hypothetical protein